ncbi:cytochrome P450 [Labedaea rhizosphaerae]|uniref:Cytochrome P450 n=1 Tax=Labedaea rhizosphaerae TaxID=598644 RepID=A0A4R6SGP1_LABRH|nr:cytochrome P450 [Labedaea rhizosphaerae]TDQ00915.1 cytochrome P450 [Labedaea rhizosphaerae]
MTRAQPTSTPNLSAYAQTALEAPPIPAGVLDTVRAIGTVVGPALLTGVIKRRPRMMWLAEKLRLDRAAIATMRHLRRRYDGRPVLLRTPIRHVEVPTAGADVGRVLAGTPDPFTAATLEKRAALRHFQPHGVLISKGAEREERRAFNEAALEPEQPMHDLAPGFVTVLNEEGRRMLAEADATGEFGWDCYARHFWAAIRRIVLGDHARDDHELTDLLGSLRMDANWAYLHRRRRAARAEFLRRVEGYVDEAWPGSLAAMVAETPASPGVDRAGQIPHWLFAFDAVSIATFRALALLATHPDQEVPVRSELEGLDLTRPQQLPYLRSCVLESVRLWPTTPVVLRENTRDADGSPRGTTQFIYSPFFHRDRETSYADSFRPGIWLDGTASDNPALVPFSAGPAQCPGRGIVLLAASTMLAVLVEEHEFRLVDKDLVSAERPLPASLDNFSLRFRACAMA